MDYVVGKNVTIFCTWPSIHWLRVLAWCDYPLLNEELKQRMMDYVVGRNFSIFCTWPSIDWMRVLAWCDYPRAAKRSLIKRSSLDDIKKVVQSKCLVHGIISNACLNFYMNYTILTVHMRISPSFLPYVILSWSMDIWIVNCICHTVVFALKTCATMFIILVNYFALPMHRGRPYLRRWIQGL